MKDRGGGPGPGVPAAEGGTPSGPEEASAELAAVDAVLGAVLDGEAVDAVADRVADAATRHLPGHRIVVAGRVGRARVAGRQIDLPRRVLVALDRVSTGVEPGHSPVGEGAGAPAPVDLDLAPWSGTAQDLASRGLGAPRLLALGDGRAPLGVLAAFPIVGAEEPPDDLGARLSRWGRVASLALARDADGYRLRRSKGHDEVTGLPDRSVVVARLREALHRHPRRPLVVILAELDRLDDVLDGLSGGDGDEVLRVVADRMRAVVRPGDVVGHLRATAFAVICEGIGAPDGLDVAERVRAALTAPVEVGDHEVAVRPGIGVVEAVDHDTVPDLLHKAGMAARDARRAGGGEVAGYRTGSYEAAAERINIERDLRRALEDEGLRLVYQPQVALADGRLVGAEALVRWDDETRGPVSPDEFIPVAEDTGLVVDLGTWAVDAAVQAIAAGLGDLVVSVNVSARQLDHPGLVETTAATLERHGVAPSRLCLEITESALVRDVERSSALLRSLHALGVQVSIDDFGTGYASLEHLRQVDVAESLKIDRTFVAGIVDDARDRAIVGAAITLGRSLGFTVVAEGVEDASQAALLAEMGCDAAQGFHFGEGVSAAELAVRAGV